MTNDVVDPGAGEGAEDRPSREELMAKVDKQRAKLAKVKRDRDRWREKAAKHKAQAKSAKRRYQAVVDPADRGNPIAGPDTPIDDDDS